MLAELVMPLIGEDITEVKVQRIPVRKGHYLTKDEIFIEVESDKVDISLPSTVEGRIIDIAVKEGEFVKAGQTLVRVDSVDDEKRTILELETQDLSAALRYLSDLDSAYLCSRTELGSLTFEGFKSFVDDAAELGQAFTGLSLADLDQSLQEELRAALFFVTDLMRMLVGFAPKDLGFKKYREHRRIYDALSKDSQFSVQILRDLLSRADVSLQSPDHDPNRAYVFISYSHHDAKPAFEIATKLREARIAHFLDPRIGFGEPIPTRLHEELGRATHLIALISPASIQSPWVHYELGFARAREVTIIPYLFHADMQVPLFIANERSVTKDDEGQLLKELTTHKGSAEPGRKRLMIQTWRSPFAKERIGKAMQIWHQSMASYTSIRDAEKELEQFVRRGGHLWCILSDPAGAALERSSIRNLKETSSVQRLAEQFEETRKVLAEIARRATSKDAVVLKAIDFVPEPIVTLVDPQSPLGVAFVTLSGFRQAPAARPHFLLSRQQEEEWFNFYHASFWELWTHTGARTINLTGRDRIAP